MEGHDLVCIEWIASAAGSGFVAACQCGFVSAPGADRADALAEVTEHVAFAFSNDRPRRRFGRRQPVVDLRDGTLVR
ncbi:MAG: hypothetical protein QOJ09_2653 [Actinomycetota bacterium]|jgi:hypothetical protein|nr:hypothetical protein [Actinomycetota bacterium]